MKNITGHSPAADFDHPLEMLVACHDRIKTQCGTLQRLAAHLQTSGNDQQARQAAANIIRYFDTAGRHHHADEEQDLLPRMMAAATIGRGSVLTRLIAELCNEHREMERTWRVLRVALESLVTGEGAALDALTVDRFVKLYHAHIAAEEANMLPLAGMLLGKDDLAEIGASMALRRGVKT